MDGEDQQTDNSDELERYHRQLVDAQNLELSNKVPKVDHPVHLFRVKLLWKLSYGRAAKAVKLGVNYRKLAYVCLPIFMLFCALFIFSVFVPRTINYSFSSANHCAFSPELFPSWFSSSAGNFTLKRTQIKILGFSLYSNQLCAQASTVPSADLAYKTHETLNILGLKLSKTISIKTGNYILADAPKLGVGAIPIQKPLKIHLMGVDQTFSYVLSANNQTAICQKTGSLLTCNLAPLKLSYGATYKLNIDRQFNNKLAGTLLSKTIQTITATAITSTSIASGSTVYNKPQSLTLTTSKNLTKLGAVGLSYSQNGKTVTVPVQASFKANLISVSWTDVLPRQTTFDLHVASVSAVDDSALEQPYDLTFGTSGGPTVIGTNMPSFGLNSGQALNVTFDQPLDPNQNIGALATLIVNSQVVGASVSLSGNDGFVITPSSGYPTCASVKLVISSSVMSNYDIGGNSAWTYTSRSHCYTTYSIGTSVQGRPIKAYQFGSNPGSNMVLFIGAMHGAEQNSGNLLNQWIPDIDANPGKIPAGRTIVVIPIINPDGYAADNRLNAQGIDLNRNFPANGWTEQVTEPLSGNTMTNDGGPYPLSAPESAALATFYETYKPRLTLTFHSHAGIVEANDAGDSIALGAEYANLADYRAIPTYLIGNFFDYSTTGAFEDWANDKFNLPVLVVELESATNDEYSRNLPALWAMAQVSP
ncbi:MAG TPA: DUF2817 domain-containing protein [Candidatus Saccharimonadales bacterium]|nr:DUF2817 domain-containing protein [Candidatus Saccharimonadales bacterium]